MKLDREKVRQALQEFAYMFGVTFALAFSGFVSGWTKLPNLNEVKAAFAAALVSACVATAKAVVWYLSGTKVPRPKG